MKKQIYSSAAILLFSLTASDVMAQSKIKDGTISGTSSLPRAGAILELESSNKGAMMPRVSLTATTTWGVVVHHFSYQ